LINNFSPPLTTSSRSSVALDATPPLSSGGGAVLVVKQEHTLNGPQTNNFNALVNAAFFLCLNGFTIFELFFLVKRSRDTKAELTEKAKRPRPNHRTKSEKALRDLVGPIVSETVSDFHRERIADRSLTCDRRMVTTNAIPSTSHDVPSVTQAPIVSGTYFYNYASQTTCGASNLVGTSPLSAATRPQGSANSTLPSSMEQLLERQWEQGSQFLISQAQFDVAQLLSCLHQLKTENGRLEEQLVQLNRRREHLLALTSRLSVPLGGPPLQQQQLQHQQQPAPSLNNQAQASLTTVNVCSTPSISVTAPTLATSSTTQPAVMTTTSTAPAVSAELAANISPERLAALNPLINSGFLGRNTNQMLNTGNAMVSMLPRKFLKKGNRKGRQYENIKVVLRLRSGFTAGLTRTRCALQRSFHLRIRFARFTIDFSPYVRC
uniref:Homeobox protein cut-like n=1 Tax=Angiostrongylus cantonensis TaxID=6313 RepID=A0A0K0DKQ9_ANGCA